jgi:hypothetical protein
MFNLTYYQIGHFSQVYHKKYTCHSSLGLIIKKYMSTSQKWLINQLGPFENPWIVVMKGNFERNFLQHVIKNTYNFTNTLHVLC